MRDKKCIVTGGTSGIGRATALALAEKGATVIIIGRNEARCEQTVKQIRSAAQVSQINYLVADLSSKDEINRLAKEFKNKNRHLDVLVNNVGARFMTYIESADGYEMTFALNHLCSFLMTHLLLNELKKSEKGRIINISSGAHAKYLDLDYLTQPEPYDGRKAYAQSKLANLLFTYDLARRLKNDLVTVNAVNPGGVATNFNRNNGLKYWLRHILAHIVQRNLVGPSKGAETIVHLASSQKVDGVSGKYYYQMEEIDSSPGSYDRQSAKQLWDLSEKITEISMS